MKQALRIKARKTDFFLRVIALTQWCIRKRRLRPLCHHPAQRRGQVPSPSHVGKLTPAPPATRVGDPKSLNFLSTRARSLKKVRRAENKAKKKRGKMERKKRDKPQQNSPADAASTPINNSHIGNQMISVESILLMDRSLRDMLASDDDRSHDDCANESAVSQSRVTALESQLLAATIALEGERNEVSRLKCYVDLIEADCDTQKSELCDM